MLEEFWSQLDAFEKILWVVASVFTLMFIFQSIFTFLAGGDESAFGDADDYVDGDGGIDYQFFTVKNMIAFFSIFGWIGLGCYTEGLSIPASVILGVISGITVVFLMVWLMKKISALKEDGTLNFKNAILKTGTVYLTIPATRNGVGKVQIMLQGSSRDLDAITDDEENIPTGKLITVIGLKDNLLIVTTKTPN
jgi:hypothetical protein